MNELRPDAQIRYFCLVLPNGRNNLGFDYLQALDQTGRGVLACAIGQGWLMSPPWDGITRLFQGSTAKRFVNIVCSPTNFLMGTRTVRAPDGTLAPNGSGEVVYSPPTSISGLYTVGVPNVAITLPRPKPPEDHEIRALAQYDAVLAPTEADAEALRGFGVAATCVQPEPDRMRRVVDRLLASKFDDLPAHRSNEEKQDGQSGG